jgi:hypothetical protein
MSVLNDPTTTPCKAATMSTFFKFQAYHTAVANGSIKVTRAQWDMLNAHYHRMVSMYILGF